ncbi:caspase family protein [Amycolatopsis sp. NPDC098790]|uniref:caspase family protein n=1 Tax=Amycolatopsis sp. NPDC098790 TaxID=3363939 RepID=UPI00380EC6C6
METLFYHVRVDLQARHFPVPQQRTRNDGKAIALVRNRHRVGRRAAREPAVDEVRVLPQPPAGAEALLRLRPADLHAEVRALRERGREEVAEQVLAASAALRPDQEVAAIIALLHARGTGEDAATALTAAARRPPAEVLRIVDALHDTELPASANQLVRAAGRCRFADTATLAGLLQAGGRTAELVELLNAAFDAAQARGSLIELVNALWLGGLREEVDRLIVRAAGHLPGADIAALADELREVGREEVAFGLYAASADVVATRPVRGVAQLCGAMADAGRAADSARVADAVIGRARDVDPLLEVMTLFWETRQEPHADRAMARAAELLPDTGITALAAALRGRGHEEAAFRLCSRAALSRSSRSVLEIVAALREEGRPVDARKLVEEVAGRAVVGTVAELLRECGDGDRQRIFRATVDRGPEFCAALLAALGAVDPVLARRFTDQVTETVATHPELAVAVIDRLEPSMKERMFASLVDGDDVPALVDQVRTLPAAEARTLLFLAVQAGKPSLADVFAALADDGSVPEHPTGQPVDRLGALVGGLQARFPGFADAVLAEAAAAGRGDHAIVRDVVHLFGSGDPAAGRALLRTALGGRSSIELKSIVATLREHDQPESLAAAAEWVRETYAWMGSNADGFLRQLGLREHSSRKGWLSRRQS